MTKITFKKILRIFTGTAIILLYVLLLPASPEIYQWKDKNGNIVFSDSPPGEPEGLNVQTKKVRLDRIDKPPATAFTPLPKTETPRDTSPPTVGRAEPHSDIKVLLYMTDWCPYCKKAREYINSIGADLTEYNVDKDKDRRKEMLVKSGGAKGVPLIDIEGTIIRGFSPAAIDSAIEKRKNM